MMSDRLRARLRALDRPEEPSPAFRESLYQQLARRADIAAPTDLPWTAPVAAPVKVRAASGRRRWLPLLVAATVATSLAGGLAALSTRPAEQACEPALAARLIESAPNLDYSYTARGTMLHELKTMGDGRFRLEGQHASPDRVHERYLEGAEIAFYAQGADEAVRVGPENWIAHADPSPEHRWTSAVDLVELGMPNLAALPRDRVAFLLQGSTEPATPVAWVAAPAEDGVCRLTGSIAPSPSSAARRILTVEVARNATLPTTIHEEWLDFRDLDGEWTHDATWQFTPADGPPSIEPPPPETVAPPFMLPEEIAEAQPSPQVTIDGLGSAVVDVAPGDPEDGEIRVTILEIREDAGYGESVPYPGTTFLAIRSRQEAIQSTDGGAGALRWIAVPSGGSVVLPVLAWRIEGGYEPILETRLTLRPDESLEGWMHLVAPATGGVDAYWTLGGSTVEPPLLVRLRARPRHRQRGGRRRTLGSRRL